MPSVPSSKLQVNGAIEAPAPDSKLTITVDPAQPLKVGSYVFRLEVVDNAGNRSKPMDVKLVITDTQAPTAIISAPSEVAFGLEFILDGSKSFDSGGGTISKYIWTLMG